MRIFKHFFKSLEKLNCPFCNIELKSGINNKIIRGSDLGCYNCGCEVSISVSGQYIAIRKMYNQDLIGLMFEKSKVSHIMVWLNFVSEADYHSSGYLDINIISEVEKHLGMKDSEYLNVFADIRSKETFYKAIDKIIMKLYKKQIFK